MHGALFLKDIYVEAINIRSFFFAGRKATVDLGVTVFDVSDKIG
jgi:hypothetical protein